MHYYKRNLGDYAKKAGRLSMLQHGAYNLLIDACYDREQFPTVEEAIDWAWASTPAEEDAVRFVLSKFFALKDGRYVLPWVAEELSEYRQKAETNARIARDRETKRKEKSTKRARVVHESSPDDNEAPPNQEPLTIKEQKQDQDQDQHQELPPTAAQAQLIEPDPVFGFGLDFLKSKGVAERGARSFLGKLRKDMSDDLAVTALLTKAEAEDISDPIAWLSKAARARGSPGLNGAGRKPSVADSFHGKSYKGTPEHELPDWATN